jgi:hypothetical protein
MSGTLIVSIIGVAIAGMAFVVGTLYYQRRQGRRDEERLQRERAHLQAEYVSGPTKKEGEHEYRFMVTNTGQATAGDPQCWLLGEGDSVASEYVKVGGGLLMPGREAEISLTVATLDHPLKLHLFWYDDTGNHDRDSGVNVPRSDEEAAATWRRS